MTGFGWGWVRLGLLAALTSSLIACGGGAGISLDAPSSVVEPSGPGQVLAVTPLAGFTAAQIAQALAGAKAPPLVPRYGVANYRIEYLSTDVDGKEIRVSGLVSLPLKPADARSPVLSYQHATIFSDAEAPSRAIAPDQPPIVMASLGYLTVAADYIGYGTSRGTPHPYLLSKPSADAVIDLLTAARTLRLRHQIVSNGQLFMVGYSEGGYVTMAAHRALQAGSTPHRAELRLTVPGAGPYNLTETLDVLLRRVKDENFLLGALIDPGFLRFLGNDIRDEVRRLLIKQLIPDDADVAFDTRFIDAYLADDRNRIEQQSNVHDWLPALPIPLFHGRQDQTVPFSASTTTVTAMLARGAAGVALTECTHVPSGHKDCVPEYWQFMLDRLAPLARDL